MSNWRVSSTRTSWPRRDAASTRARVLYNSAWRDRMTRRMAASSGREAFPFRETRALVRRGALQAALEIGAADVHEERAGQGAAAEDHAEAHAVAPGQGDLDAPRHRPQADQRLDDRAQMRRAAAVADHRHAHDRRPHRQRRAL